MADQRKTRPSGLTSRDLYVKANPGLLATAPDVTNPRDWYAATSTRRLLGSFVNQYNNVQKEAAPPAPGPRNAALYMALPGIKHSGVGLPLPVQAENFPDRGRRKSLKSIASHEDGSAEEEDPKSLAVVGHSATEDILHTPSTQGTTGTRPIPKNWKVEALAPLSKNTYTKSTYKPDRPPAPLESRQKTTVTKLDIEKLLPPKKKSVAPLHMEYIMRQTTFNKTSANMLSEKFGDLLLPKQQKDVKEINDFRQNYFARQKSILNLKLDHNLPLRVREPTMLNPIQRKPKVQLEEIIPVLEEEAMLSTRSDCRSRLSITSSKAPMTGELERKENKTPKEPEKPQPEVYRGPFVYESPRILRPDRTATGKARLNVITLAPVQSSDPPTSLKMSLSKSLENLSIMSPGSHAPIGGSMPERTSRKGQVNHHKSNPNLASLNHVLQKRHTPKVHNLHPFSERLAEDEAVAQPATPMNSPRTGRVPKGDPQATLYQDGNHITVRFMNESQRNRTMDETISAMEYANLFEKTDENPPNITVHQATPLPNDAKSSGSR